MNHSFDFRRAIRLAAAACAALALSATANEANYQNYQLGDRAAGMGGGISAIADSIDATFYNPAGLTRTPKNSLSLSANLYGFQRIEVDDAMFPNENFQTDSFQSVPSSAGGALRLSSNTVAAFSAFIPAKGSYNETVAFPQANHYYNLSQDFQSLWLGPSVGHALSPRLSLGLSAFAVYETFTMQQTLYWGDVSEAYALGVKYDSWSAVAAAGLQYQMNEYWSAGLSMKSPSARISSDGQWLEHVVEASTHEQGGKVFYVKDLRVENLRPAELRFGIAREVPKVWAVGADVTYHLPTSFTRLKGTSIDGKPLTRDIRRAAVVDVNAGVEYVLKRKYPVRAGFFTSRSSAPDLELSETDFPPQINLYGLTFTVGTETKNSAVNVGVNYLFGKGHDFGWAYTSDGVGNVIVDRREEYLYFIFNTLYYF